MTVELDPPVSSSPPDRTSPRITFAAAVIIGIGYVKLLLATAADIGYARDEGFYFQTASGYQRWFVLLGEDRGKALSQKVVDGAWKQGNEHPSLMKSLFALSNLFLEKRHHFFDLEGTSYRFPAMVLAGLLVGVLFAFVARRFGFVAGLVASLGLGFMPAFFHHAHLACFDVPIAAMFAFTALAYAKSLETKGPGWPIATGVLFGLALDTKHNAWFIPIAASLHFALTLALAKLAGVKLAFAVKRSFVTLVAMAIIGPLVFYALWPWIWHDTYARVSAYVSFHMNHEYYNMEFLGENYWQPPMPRLYAWVMTVATVPTITLLLAAIGAGACFRDGIRSVRARDAESFPKLREDLFFALCLFMSYAAWLRTSTPIFGGTKHWMTAYPFFTLFGAQAFSRLAFVARQHSPSKLRVGIPRLAPTALLGASVLVAPIVETLHAHPFGLSAYVPIVGGAPGAASLGLNRSFWGYTTANVAPFLNRVAPQGGRVYIHDTAYQSWQMLQADGTIRRDLVAVGSINEADFGIYHHEMHMQGQEYQNWVAFDTVAPSEIAGPDGVPVVMVYVRPRAPAR